MSLEPTAVAADYASALSELTTNSKPLISMLTMLADENKAHAAKIVTVIEEYLDKSSAKVKLLALYLIDSIVKNVKEPYIALFTENIVKLFAEVFQKGDEKVRAALWKVRQTWKGIFPDRKLYVLDITTKAMDPHWPIVTAESRLPAPIHLNPRFFGRQTTGSEEAELSENHTRSQTEQKKPKEIKSHVVQGDAPTKQSSHVLKANAETPKNQKSDEPKEKRHDPRLKKKELAAAKSTNKGSSSDKRHSKQTDKESKDRRSEEKSRSSEGRSTRSSSRTSPKKSSQENKGTKRTAAEDTSATTALKSSSTDRMDTLADKEAATILTGDIDLRLLEPQTKKRKHEEVSVAEELPKEDVDLRIRPAGGVSDPGKPMMSTESQDGSSPVVVGDDEDEDQAVQWAKVKGKTLAQVAAENSVMPLKDLRPHANRTATQHPLPAPNEKVIEVGPKNPLFDLHPGSAQRKTVRFSDPAPDQGQIRLDGRMREVRFVDGVAIAIMEELPPNFVRARQIMFRGGTKRIVINDNHHVLAAFDGREHEFTLNGNRHRIRFGAPLRELYIDGIPYACQFNGLPIYIRSREDVFSVTLHPPCPSVNDKMEATPELLAKLGLKPLDAAPPGAAFVAGGPFVAGHPGHAVVTAAGGPNPVGVSRPLSRAIHVGTRGL